MKTKLYSKAFMRAQADRRNRPSDCVKYPIWEDHTLQYSADSKLGLVQQKTSKTKSKIMRVTLRQGILHMHKRTRVWRFSAGTQSCIAGLHHVPQRQDTSQAPQLGADKRRDDNASTIEVREQSTYVLFSCSLKTKLRAASTIESEAIVKAAQIVQRL